ncbi:hypothetical protein RC1_0636 [Rhodospirillum centenum SW]|uniref:Uncharacterized protein n=1 Tax=Rhodospirillum centenum (strain ATCC 51521 / SW) TaxID=414684 RepID=B6IRI5_RHOCS|nr:hypothetical protein RC1_0636 [Rhodospirillum centenum SW]
MPDRHPGRPAVWTGRGNRPAETVCHIPAPWSVRGTLPRY